MPLVVAEAAEVAAAEVVVLAQSVLPPDSHFDPADPHNLGVEDEDGVLQTIDEIYRKGLKKKQARTWRN
ncbi:MAG: hypothetical protein U5K27_17095 [Desulfotignum sp.]|nr:hypothetical protein [Desulfotignum sp.]